MEMPRKCHGNATEMFSHENSGGFEIPTHLPFYIVRGACTEAHNAWLKQTPSRRVARRLHSTHLRRATGAGRTWHVGCSRRRC
eukprot:3283688-Prymnesium_polylepis.1